VRWPGHSHTDAARAVVEEEKGRQLSLMAALISGTGNELGLGNTLGKEWKRPGVKLKAQ
jgi:hypothetical protein